MPILLSISLESKEKFTRLFVSSPLSVLARFRYTDLHVD